MEGRVDITHFQIEGKGSKTKEKYIVLFGR